jgi:hypothetical protein
MKLKVLGGVRCEELASDELLGFEVRGGFVDASDVGGQDGGGLAVGCDRGGQGGGCRGWRQHAVWPMVEAGRSTRLQWRLKIDARKKMKTAGKMELMDRPTLLSLYMR